MQCLKSLASIIDKGDTAMRDPKEGLARGFEAA